MRYRRRVFPKDMMYPGTTARAVTRCPGWKTMAQISACVCPAVRGIDGEGRRRTVRWRWRQRREKNTSLWYIYYKSLLISRPLWEINFCCMHAVEEAKELLYTDAVSGCKWYWHRHTHTHACDKCAQYYSRTKYFFPTRFIDVFIVIRMYNIIYVYKSRCDRTKGTIFERNKTKITFTHIILHICT